MNIQEQIEALRGPVGPLMYQNEDGIALTIDAAVTLEKLYAVYLASGEYIQDIGDPVTWRKLGKALAAVKEQE